MRKERTRCVPKAGVLGVVAFAGDCVGVAVAPEGCATRVRGGGGGCLRGEPRRLLAGGFDATAVAFLGEALVLLGAMIRRAGASCARRRVA